jgi:LmbE family N-acetylglucosaminyl deacetylase
MTRPGPPPGTTGTVEASRALVIAPHFDDEVLGCGGLVAQLTAAGGAVRVVFCSDGGGDSADPERRRALSERRREEAARAAAILGLAGIDELGLPDGALARHVDALAEGLGRLLLAQRPHLVLVPSPLEVSDDHRAAFAALHRALAPLRGERGAALAELQVLAYEVNHPLHPDLLVDVGAQVGVIERAMACYASQQAEHDYLAVKLGLLRFRTLTLPSAVTAAEAYRRLAPSDFTTRGPARLTAELGGVAEAVAVDEGPTISLIVRTRDRPDFLAEALASVASSTYRRLEVVVVNDGGAAPVRPADFPLPLTVVDLPVNRGRAEAANAGIARARGDHVAFLDDDDLVEPEHFAVLAGLVRGAGIRVAYTDAAVGIYEPSPEAGWRCVERRLPYSRDFDPERLLFDNYIPFNTLLIERALLTAAGPLDAGLPIFEDWDLLIRLSERAAFHHLARVTCEYRHFRAPFHHGLGERPRARADFLTLKARVIDKHRARITPELTARVIDRLRAEIVDGEERAAALGRDVAALARGEAQRQAATDALHRDRDRMHLDLEALHRDRGAVTYEVADLQRQLRERLAQIEDLHRQAAERAREIEAVQRDAEAWRRERDAVASWREQAEALAREVRAMQATRAWRAAEWWRAVRRTFSGPRA